MVGREEQADDNQEDRMASADSTADEFAPMPGLEEVTGGSTGCSTKVAFGRCATLWKTIQTGLWFIVATLPFVILLGGPLVAAVAFPLVAAWYAVEAMVGTQGALALFALPPIFLAAAVLLPRAIVTLQGRLKHPKVE